MARSTLPVTQPDHDQTQSQAQAQAQAPSSSLSSRPVIALVAQLVTLACLVVSTSLLVSNSTSATITNLSTIAFYSTTVTVKFNDIYAYRYALATAVIGVFYSLLQLSFSIERLRSGKILSNHARLVVYECLGDKVVLALLATGVGATFGATLDLKRIMDNFDDYFVQSQGITTFSPLRSKLDDFFNRAYFAAMFLLISIITTGISSLLSSLNLINNTTT